MNDVDRATIFGRDAGNYDRSRPGYPDEVLAHILERADPEYLVEVGAGTGKATELFADGRRRITCLEPDPEMAEKLRAKELPGVSVEVVRFEEWEGNESVDLLLAAQSWHWVDGAVGFGKAMELLRPGGLIALLWNVPIDRYARFTEIYREYGPEILEEEDGRIYERDRKGWLHDLEVHGFVHGELFVHPWSARMDPLEFRQLCSTYSDHMLIPEPRRSRLLDALQAGVVSSGGFFDIEYEARVFTGLKYSG